MNVAIGAQTDVGRAREGNEDGFLAEDPLYAVADGMGGHRAGEVASRMALEALAEIAPDDGPHSLPERVKAANRIVHQHSSDDRDLEGMGTTLTALVLDGNEARIAHVGDSRAYLLRDGDLRMLTEDHTLVQRMVREGKLTREEAGVHPQRSILTRALGVEAEVDVDELTVPLQAGDRVLLCTDGLTSMVDEELIADVLRRERDPQRAADLLVESANEAGGHDNITVVVLDVGDGGRAPGEQAEEPTRTSPAVAAPAAAADGEVAPGADDTLVTTADALSPAEEPAGAQADWRGVAEPARRRRWPRWVAGTVVVLVLLGVGGKLFVDRQWFVGVDEGNVAIFRGIPTEILGLSLATVEERTDLSAEAAQEFPSWADLDEGIAVADRAAAEDLVEQIRADVERDSQEGGERRAGPSPSPSPI